MSDSLPELYKKMSEHTAPECSHSCRAPHSCCSPEYCDMAEQWAKDRYGVELQKTSHPRLKFMGPTGCTVAPHFRPICTVHTCEVNGLGFKKIDPGGVWTTEYFRLRDLIEEKEGTES